MVATPPGGCPSALQPTHRPHDQNYEDAEGGRAKHPVDVGEHAAAKFDSHVGPETVQKWSLPRPARKAPSATAVSAGRGGMTFSSAASAVTRAYSSPGGSRSRNARRSLRGGPARAAPRRAPR